jgi:hypothetical protein
LVSASKYAWFCVLIRMKLTWRSFVIKEICKVTVVVVDRGC